MGLNKNSKISAMNMRIDGVYNALTYSYLREQGVGGFVFDMRPLSMNFLQEYVLIELLTKHYSPMAQYFLKFQNEKDFIIKKIIDDIRPLLSGGNNLFLEFADQQEASYYEQFKLPYFWHFASEQDLLHLLSSTAATGPAPLKGVILHYDLLLAHFRQQSLREFLALFGRGQLGKNVDVILKLHWSDSLLTADEGEHLGIDELLAAAPFLSTRLKYYSFPIDKTLETTYRQINLDRLQKQMSEWMGPLSR